jgi:hypothetical protein
MKRIVGGTCGAEFCPTSQMGGEITLPTYETPTGPYTVLSKMGGKRSGKRSETLKKYKPTKKNRKYLAKWKQGKSIGFTMRSSLKAKGLIPRANGTKRVSDKYKDDFSGHFSTSVQQPYTMSPTHSTTRNAIGGFL